VPTIFVRYICTGGSSSKFRILFGSQGETTWPFHVSTNTNFLFRHLVSTPSHHHNPTTTATFLYTLPPTKHGREHRRAWRRENGGCTRYAYYIFLLISISCGFPLPAQSSLSWGIPHLSNYATPSRRTWKMRHLQQIFRFRRLFFGGYLGPSPPFRSRQHPPPVSPPPSHLPNMKNAPFVGHFSCSAAILCPNTKNVIMFAFFVFGGYFCPLSPPLP